ncbi:glycogen/starch synthase [Subsaxibacter sp. CAU 1640]|uniref:glycogen synthase n=1 Tax=Subsaxibacter sp. CAU 1640 TaxID=2933271 RepID=UPI002003F4AB|nr:glycogen/starch synthase [Subsaxibacter sp. CAU 1640]MCK7589475.1 glycogen/starch synthase [Subsaxibacter sp. CAU 1640]
MTIFHLSAECYPIAKVGGLGDVVGALPKYQNKLGEKSSVIMPFYDNKFTRSNNFKTVYSGKLHLGMPMDFRMLTLEDNDLGFDIYFVDVPYLLYKDYVYSSNDTGRFLAFQIAALDWLVRLQEKPDVIHCHDHHTGLVPFMMSQCYAFQKLKSTPSVITIHNGQYQGWFGHDLVHLIPPFDFNNVGLLDWNKMVNPLAAGIKCSWKVTTVSPSYMEELKYAANGLEHLLQSESHKCVGILNGIDTSVWNPKTDGYIVKNYTTQSVESGKKGNKDWVCEKFGLSPELPLFIFIGRLVGEKGADLLPYIFDSVLRSKKLSIMMLGSGDGNVENQLESLKNSHNGYYNNYIGYNEQLSHILYAAADFILMPSRVEPCGLNQMYALRYGTVPIVNSVGGLKDTVIDVGEKGFGIRHGGPNVHEVVHAVGRAIEFTGFTEHFKKNRKLIMQIDHSWDASAQTYINLYHSIQS